MACVIPAYPSASAFDAPSSGAGRRIADDLHGSPTDEDGSSKVRESHGEPTRYFESSQNAVYPPLFDGLGCFERQRRKRLAACFLFVIFVRPSIGQTLANDAFQQFGGAFLIVHAKR
jgi:hypothetical protein